MDTSSGDWPLNAKQESSYVGFSLQRDLQKRGYACEVVAPSSIPRRAGKSNRLGITRQGNRYLRTAFIEANQRGYRSASISKDVKARRANIRTK